ncbi:MAG: restriction endonuclease [Deltaproteobacteria bacterium]|nr:restriction endonuclease [Deltaproteobacteria bacterium]
MAIPTYEMFMLPLLRLAAQGEIKNADTYEKLADEFHLSAEEREQLLPSGRQTVIANRVGWARTYLSKAGLLERSQRGQYRITERGKAVLKEKPSHIDDHYLKQFPEFREFQGRPNVSPDPPSIITPDEIIRAAHAELEDALGQELLDRILDKSPAFFERLVVQLLVAMGYGGSLAEAGRSLGRSGDGGVDGVIDQDALGLDRIYVQAKRYVNGNTVGSSAIRDFFGSLDRFKAAKGLFVTTSTFTDDARKTAELLSKRIVLIDGKQLVRLMIRYGVGCRVEDTLYLKKIDEDFFE